MDDYKRYNKMEMTLHVINQLFIALPDEEIHTNNDILLTLLEKIVLKMRDKDVLFDKLYNKIFYGGSYYDGLKVGNPDEYDIDMILGSQKTKKRLIEITPSQMEGFVHAELLDDSFRSKLCEKGSNKLHTDKVKQWIQSLVQKVLNEYDYKPSYGYDLKSLCGKPLWIVKLSTQGPACTFKIKASIRGKYIQMDMDLVPCFYCFPDQWPCKRPNPFPDMGFLIVPKKPSNNSSGEYWRLSFQEQERSLLLRKERVKPAIRLLKKMRDTANQPVASYFLKTIALWELDKEDTLFWHDKSLSYTFMRLLKAYALQLKYGEIPYYWDRRYNLLKFSQQTHVNFANYLERIIKDIERNLEDEECIAKYILNPAEHKRLKDKDIPPEVIQEAKREAEASTVRCVII